ncbi:MAG: fructose-6-phosphate aldolase [Moorea sp. SIO4A3]|nr:fructose-6-phosphate aldolase [Moorena sp. SIO4A3]
MLELYLDSADVEQIARFHSCLPIKGITTNPSILAQANLGVNQLLKEVNTILGNDARFHIQVISQSVDEIIVEAEKITALPYDIVVKIPATEIGLVAIKQLHQKQIPLLATAIYTVQQGFLAALAGADYLAPYVNRIDVFGRNGVTVVEQLQQLVEQQQLSCCLLPASFKNSRQVLEVLQAGVGAITLPVGLMGEMVSHPATPLAVEQFNTDWQQIFGDKLAFET